MICLMVGASLHNIKGNSGKANMTDMGSIRFMMRKIQILLLSTTKDTFKMVYTRDLECNLNKADFQPNR
jgi:hypothetical protein